MNAAQSKQVVQALSVLLCVLAGCSKDASAIKLVINANADEGKRAFGQEFFLDKGWEETEKVEQYVKRMRTISLEGNPDDFRQAFGAYIQACESYLEVMKTYPKPKELTHGISAEYQDGKMTEATKKWAKGQYNVLDTWGRVKKTAAQHGADLGPEMRFKS